jgi:hypothetical protein
MDRGLSKPRLPGFQQRFHARWSHLNDPLVRTLAFLLDSPELLDADGRVAVLPPAEAATAEWLAQLDRDPAPLHAFMDSHPHMRLGRFAEKLMAFYFLHEGSLHAHGLQVQSGKGHTLGEFDFLLRRPGGLEHWEFATKLYLLEPLAAQDEAHRFVGPNLADTLGIKMRKIMERQLMLARHPAALALLDQPVIGARALVKGWLFYHGATPPPPRAGVAPMHCQGFWCETGALPEHPDATYCILPRLRWLPPLKARPEECLPFSAFRPALQEHFQNERSPVLVSLLEARGGVMLEFDRGFIVPDGWREQAGERISRMIANAQPDSMPADAGISDGLPGR